MGSRKQCFASFPFSYWLESYEVIFLSIPVNIPPWEKNKTKTGFWFSLFSSFIWGVEGRGCAVGVFFLVEGCVGGFGGGFFFFLFRNMLRM